MCHCHEPGVEQLPQIPAGKQKGKEKESQYLLHAVFRASLSREGSTAPIQHHERNFTRCLTMRRKSYNATKGYSIHTLSAKTTSRHGPISSGLCQRHFNNTNTPEAFENLDAQTSQAYAYTSQPTGRKPRAPGKPELEVSQKCTRTQHRLQQASHQRSPRNQPSMTPIGTIIVTTRRPTHPNRQ